MINLDFVQSFGVSKFLETKLREEDGTVIGHQSVGLDNTQYPICGGTAEDLNVARRIAVAEGIERYFVLNQADKQAWRLDLIPSSCGFAAGFQKAPTQARAIHEAVERWAWSQWIDFKKPIQSIAHPKISRIGELFTKPFESVRYYQKSISLGADTNLVLHIVIGLTREGIFPGSRVCDVSDEGWTHALTEAWRHYQVSLGEMPKKQKKFNDRIFYFAKHRENGLSQIPSESSPDKWTMPSIIFQKQAAFEGYFISRAIVGSYTPWTSGDETRFVY